MRMILCFVLLCTMLYETCAQGNADSLFLIDRVTNTKQIAYVLDSGSLVFYDVNDSFLFIIDEYGCYKLKTIANSECQKGIIKPKKHMRLSGAQFSEFRGNTPHIGNFQSTGFSEFHIDESTNYFYGAYVGEILNMKYLPEFNSVVLHLSIYAHPRREQLWLVSCLPVKDGKYDYIEEEQLVETPELLFDSEKISNIIVDDQSAKIAFLSSDTMLVQLDLKNTGIRNDYYDIGSDYDIGFFSEDSIVNIQKNGNVSILSLLTRRSSSVPSSFDLSDKSDFFVLGRSLFCIKNQMLFVLEIDSKGLQLKETFVFNAEIISYKVSNNGMKVLVQTR